MTKKLWNNWKNRAGETKKIEFNTTIIPLSYCDNIIDANFHRLESFIFMKDTVTISFFNMHTCCSVEITVSRADIKTVEF